MTVKLQRFDVHAASHVRVGVWCPLCLLPSVMEQDYVVIDPRLICTVRRGTLRYCDECGRRQDVLRSREG
jgi:hypothetical protein